MKKILAAMVILAFALPVMAQDAEVGKEYDITIESEHDNQFTGPFGQVKLGSILVLIPNAKTGEKYKIKVTEVNTNVYTGDKQASCDFQQIGADRKGNCLGAP